MPVAFFDSSESHMQELFLNSYALSVHFVGRAVPLSMK